MVTLRRHTMCPTSNQRRLRYQPRGLRRSRVEDVVQPPYKSFSVASLPLIILISPGQIQFNEIKHLTSSHFKSSSLLVNISTQPSSTSPSSLKHCIAATDINTQQQCGAIPMRFAKRLVMRFSQAILPSVKHRVSACIYSIEEPAGMRITRQ